MSEPETQTVTFPMDVFNEVCNLLQLMTVLNIDLYMRGNCHPDKKKLSKAFDIMTDASMARFRGENQGDRS